MAVKGALFHPEGVGKSDQELADHIGVSRRMVLDWRKHLEATRQLAKSEERTGKDGRTINTAKIGKKPAPPPEVADLSEAREMGEKQKQGAVLHEAREIRARRTEERRQERIEKAASMCAPPLDGSLGRFPVLLADPPWRYEHATSDSRAIENQYPTMSLEEICMLPVEDVAPEDRILRLWAPSPKLQEALRVLESWGFNCRTCTVCHKQRMGMGFYVRQEHELLLIATRGALPVPKPEDRPRSVIVEPWTGHSKKPESFYSTIEAMYPDLPRLELFARTERPGWQAWGNEVEPVIATESEKNLTA